MVAGIALTGCVEGELEDELELVENPDEADDTAVGLADELASENGATPYLTFPLVECSSYNVIGVLKEDFRSAHCSLGETLGPDWQWRRMFDDSTPDLAAWTEPLPPELGRYCIFEFVGPGEPNEESYTQLFTTIDAYPGMEIDSVAVDCRGEVLQGEGLNDPLVTAELANAFHDAIQWIPGAVLSPTSVNRRFAEVAIVDTVTQAAHDDPGIDPVNEHGEFMGDIVSDIACADPPQPDCENAIRYHVAMPREENEFADWAHGGTFGTMGDLARSVVAAVGHWRMNKLSDPGAPPRLIISASLGWVPEAPYNADPDRGPVRALEEALIFAACNGAVVLAAAGNTTDAACGANEHGPLAPATYELMTAPDKDECLLRGYAPLDDSSFPVFDGDRPLVQAVGVLNGFDLPAANARPGGMPALAAYGSNASVATPGGFTTPLTGTSVSTAVAAATASLVWSYAPELTPRELMKVISDSSYETKLTSDFDFEMSGQRVRRVSVCAALEYVCSALPLGHCPVLACDDPEPPADGHLGGYFLAAEAAIKDPSNTIKWFDGGAGVAPVCQAPTWDEQIDPQPEHPLCPACGLDSPPPPKPPNSDTLSMTIDSAYQGLVMAIWLVAYDAVGAPTVVSLDKDVVASVNDPDIRITRVSLDVPGTVAASLSFQLVDGSIQDGPIPVYSLILL